MTKLSTMTLLAAASITPSVRVFVYDPTELLPINRSKALLLSDLRAIVTGFPILGTAYNLDVAKILIVATDLQTQVWATPLTAARVVTLPTGGVINGTSFRIVRTAAATGAFSLNVGTGPLKALAVGQWCDVQWNGTTWYVSAFGSL